nr:copia protein [Tanacetum cinerariifolium]
ALVVKAHNKTLYELFRDRTPNLSFMRPFGCHVTILSTLDHLGKLAGKANEGYFVTYSINSKVFRVYNIRTRRVEENLHIEFLENKPIVVQTLMILQPSFGNDGKKHDRVSDKERLVTPGHTQEEGIDYDEVFAPVARIEAIRLFLAYASFMGFMVYQMDVKGAFLYGRIEEECKKQTVVATSTTEAEYVATGSCCGQ